MSICIIRSHFFTFLSKYEFHFSLIGINDIDAAPFGITYIDTPELLAQLKEAEFDAMPYQIFVVEPSAHENILTQVSRFAHSPYYEVIFKDADGSQVELQPRSRHVKADFKTANHSLESLPSAYYSYHLNLSAGAVYEQEIIQIVRWKAASELWIEGENTFALAMQQDRILRRLRRMKRIRVDVSMVTYRELQLQAFASAILLLERITFVQNGITEDEFREFADRQIRPDGWVCDFMDDFTCTKRQTNK